MYTEHKIHDLVVMAVVYIIGLAILALVGFVAQLFGWFRK